MTPTGGSTLLNERRDLGHELVGATLAAITADADQRLLVAFGAVGGAGVGDERNQITEITGVAYRALDTLVGHHTRHDQRAHPEIAQYIIDIGRDEDAARSLAKDHSSVAGAISSSTCASHEPRGTSISEIL